MHLDNDGTVLSFCFARKGMPINALERKVHITGYPIRISVSSLMDIHLPQAATCFSRAPLLLNRIAQLLKGLLAEFKDRMELHTDEGLDLVPSFFVREEEYEQPTSHCSYRERLEE
jgi:hypothetical protein